MRILAVLLLVSCDAPKKSDKVEPAPAAVAGPAATKPSRPAGPVVDVTARQLYAGYLNNEVGADAKFKDKLVRMIGDVDHVRKDGESAAVVYFDARPA